MSIKNSYGKFKCSTFFNRAAVLLPAAVFNTILRFKAASAFIFKFSLVNEKAKFVSFI